MNLLTAVLCFVIFMAGYKLLFTLPHVGICVDSLTDDKIPKHIEQTYPYIVLNDGKCKHEIMNRITIRDY